MNILFHWGWLTFLTSTGVYSVDLQEANELIHVNVKAETILDDGLLGKCKKDQVEWLAKPVDNGYVYSHLMRMHAHDVITGSTDEATENDTLLSIAERYSMTNNIAKYSENIILCRFVVAVDQKIQRDSGPGYVMRAVLKGFFADCDEIQSDCDKECDKLILSDIDTKQVLGSYFMACSNRSYADKQKAAIVETTGDKLQLIFKKNDDDITNTGFTLFFFNVKNSNVCRSHEYSCANERQCMPRNFQCDGLYHCDDLSDEVICTAAQLFIAKIFTFNIYYVLAIIAGVAIGITLLVVIAVVIFTKKKNGKVHPENDHDSDSD